MADTNHNSGPRVHARGSNGAAGDNDDCSAAIERMRGAYAEKTIGRYSRDFVLFEEWCAHQSLVALPTEPAAIEKNHIETLVVVALERRAIWGACTFCLISTMPGRPKPPDCRCGTSVVFVRPRPPGQGDQSQGARTDACCMRSGSCWSPRQVTGRAGV